MAMLIPILVGIACIVLGISNMRGNISTIHEYHRKRVKEEDKRPFGKRVGLGTVIMGVCIVIFGILSMIALKTDKEILTWIGSGIMAAGFAVGLTISFAAMIKYNKGIF